MRSSNLDPDDLNRPDWNDLQSNYDKHDIGEAYFVGRMHQIGLHVEHWGIDMRDHDDCLIFDDTMDLRLWEPLDGQEAPSTWPSDVPDDMRVNWPDQLTCWYKDDGAYSTKLGPEAWKLRGIIDVKTKTSESWLGKFNVRHFAHYAHWADVYDVPVFLYFTLVDMDAERVGEENILIEVQTDWNHELVADHYDPDSPVSLEYDDLKAAVTESSMASHVFGARDGNSVVETNKDTWRNFDYLIENVL